MKRSMIFGTLAVLAMSAGIVGRIDAAMSSSGEAIAMALTTAAPAAPLVAGPANWGFVARYQSDDAWIAKN